MASDKGSVRYLGGRKDARRSRRQQRNERGYIRPDGGFAKWPCIVLDMSDTGVRLQLEGNYPVPSTFNVVRASVGLGRRARIKWKRGQEIGAQFISD